MTDDMKKGLIEGLAMHPLQVSIIKNETIVSGGGMQKVDAYLPIQKLISTYKIENLQMNQKPFPETEGLLAYYNASSFKGTSWTDLSGNGNTMSFYGSHKENIKLIDTDAVRFTSKSRGKCSISTEPLTIYVVARSISSGTGGYSLLTSLERDNQIQYTDFCPSFLNYNCNANTYNGDLKTSISGNSSYHVICITRTKKEELISDTIKYFGDLYLYVDGELINQKIANTYAESQCIFSGYRGNIFINNRKKELDQISDKEHYDDNDIDNNFYSYDGTNDYKLIAFCSTQHTAEQIKKNSDFLSMICGTCSQLLEG